MNELVLLSVKRMAVEEISKATDRVPMACNINRFTNWEDQYI